MSIEFAVFNLHVNKAGEKADREFKRIFGEKKFARHIQPSHDEGIMSIFSKPLNVYRGAWAAMVAVIVNEGNKR